MKNIQILSVIFMTFLFSAPISESQAELVANNLFTERSNNTESIQINQIETHTIKGYNILYIIHLSPRGFILVSADDRGTPILGYSFESQFDIEAATENFGFLLNLFESEILDQINNNGSQLDVISDQWQIYLASHIDPITTRSVSPLLTARFGQGSSWNTKCPVDPAGPSGHALVGCVAVSMSQVMHYWEYPMYGNGSHGYNTYTYGYLSADFGDTFYDFDNMSAYNGNDASQTLLSHCGIAVDMDYGPDASGAWVVGSNPSAYYALKQYFQYKTSMTYIYPYQYSDSQYRQKLKDELDNNRPMIYRGYSSDGGHAWNVDGYEGDNFHCNWGWDGWNNGYFPLSTLGGFSSDQAAIINIEPQSLDSPNIVMNGFTISETVGDGDLVPNPGETIELSITLENLVPWSDATILEFALDSPYEDIMVENDYILGDSLPSGETTDNADSPFILHIDPNIQMGEYTLNLAIMAFGVNGNEFIEEYPLTLNISLNQGNFPFEAEYTIESSPVILDIDADGDMEIFYGDYGGFIHGKDHYGNDLPGFPIELEGVSKQIWGSPSADDIDNDGTIELIFTCKNKHLYIVDVYGNIEVDYETDQYLMGSPALGNIDNDPENEIIFAGYADSGDVFAINADGSDVDGFPIQLDEKVKRGVALSDFNNNGKVDIAVATESDNLLAVIFDTGEINILMAAAEKFKSAPVITELNGEKVIMSGNENGHLYAVNLNGEIVLDIETDDQIRTSPAFTTVEGELVIIFGSYDGKVYAVYGNGDPVSGWPINLNGSIHISPVIADLDGDGTPEVIVGNTDGDLYAYHLDATPVNNFPIQSGVGYSGSPIINDIDNDGDVEIILGANITLMGIDVKESSVLLSGWNMHRGNLLRNGYYAGSTFSSASGDLNQDSTVDILDIVIMINIILSESATSEQLSIGDLNQDGIIDILDIVQIINVILEF